MTFKYEKIHVLFFRTMYKLFNQTFHTEHVVFRDIPENTLHYLILKEDKIFSQSRVQVIRGEEPAQRDTSREGRFATERPGHDGMIIMDMTL